MFIAYLHYPFKGMNEGRTDWQQSPAIILWALITGVWYTPLLLTLLLIGVGIYQVL